MLAVLLQKALDPPEPDIVEDALDLLVQIGALTKLSHRGRYEPTFYGKLLACFPLSFDASVLIVNFGVAGMIHEGILLGILMDTQPLPILHPFGEEHLFMDYMECYFNSDLDSDKAIDQKGMVLIGNLCAFKFWQRVFKDKLRLQHLKEVLKCDGKGVTEEDMLKVEENWCFHHHLVQSSLSHVSEIYEDVLGLLHRFRPEFLRTSDSFPSYYHPFNFQHTCLLEDVVGVDDEQLDQSSNVNCVAGPFVSSDDFQTKDIAEKMVTVIKEIRALYAGAATSLQPIDTSSHSVCVYFLKGACSRGDGCAFTHSHLAKQPACKFFFSLKGCRNGNSCYFSHDVGSSYDRPILCIPEDDIAYSTSLIKQFPHPGEGTILILDDTNFHFTSNIARFINPEDILVSSSLSESFINDPSLENVQILWDQQHPHQTIILQPPKNSFYWSNVRCILWFPNLSRLDENLDQQAGFMQRFFEYMAIRLMADRLYNIRVILTMYTIRFSQLQNHSLLMKQALGMSWMKVPNCSQSDNYHKEICRTLKDAQYILSDL
ncbi:hypothetical protein SAY87_027816 [Trapa incisa]|uniref:C3H1-type domain-containing protein n=1 Tax=Trapa incisa TaxID=236973 RepID=A0AAN7JNF5_9MYRT|nr:hypothetical protein SAY87_027816 [Trapa incisa]